MAVLPNRPADGPSAAPGGRSHAIGVFLISAAVLALEIVHVRLVAVVLWHHLTYMVVTVALLAFGVAGTILAVSSRILTRNLSRRLSALAVLFSLSTVGTAMLMGRFQIEPTMGVPDARTAVGIFLMYALLGLPYLCGGLVIAATLTAAPDRINKLYFANLLGSAAGCSLFVLTVRQLGGPGLVFGIAILGLLAAIVYSHESRKAVVGLVVLAVLVGIAGRYAERLMPLPPAPKKVMNDLLQAGHPIERTEWSPLCRIDVIKEGPTRRVVYQDGDAPTWIHSSTATDTALPARIIPHRLQKIDKVLVIGAGGGTDLQVAREMGARSIVGVEINPVTCDLVTNVYRDFLNDLARQPGVEYVNAEGRSFLNRSHDQFDLIQLTAVDTYTALSSGAYVLAENHLYTREAFAEYFDHLTPNGILSMYRFLNEPPREILRLFVTAAEELKARGASDPGRHLAVAGCGIWAIILAQKSPFSDLQVKTLRDAMKWEPRARKFYLPGEPSDLDESPTVGNPFVGFMRALRANDEERFYGSYPFRVDPAPDDSPFFYQVHRWRDLLSRPKDVRGDYEGSRPVGHYILLTLLLQAALAGVVLVLLPLWVFKRRSLSMSHKGRTILYFAAVGLAFIFVEIALMQKLVLYLGHPTYVLSVVLFALLVFSGLGSLCSGRFSERRVLLVAPALIAVLLVLLLLCFDPIVATTLGASLPLRILIAVLVIAPIGFLMGMPFPTGLRLVGTKGGSFIPWAFGVNASASVIGSIVAIMFAIQTSFTFVILLGAGLYLVALAARPR